EVRHDFPPSAVTAISGRAPASTIHHVELLLLGEIATTKPTLASAAEGNRSSNRSSADLCPARATVARALEWVGRVPVLVDVEDPAVPAVCESKIEARSCGAVR